MTSTTGTKGNDRKFILPSMNIDTYKFSFYFSVIALWDSLSPQIANSPTTDDFKVGSYLYLKTRHYKCYRLL